MSLPERLQKKGWQIWYYQNTLYFIPLILFLPNFFFLFFDWRVGHVLGSLINLTLYFCFIFDVLAVSLISLGLLFTLSSYAVMKRKLFCLFAIVSGFSWVGTSFIWRGVLYFQIPYNVGFGLKHDSLNNIGMYDLFLNVEKGLNLPLLFFFLGGSVFLLVFLTLYDNLYLVQLTMDDTPMTSFNINIGTIYGLSNVCANLFLFFVLFLILQFVDNQAIYLLLLIVIFLKLFLVPVLGRKTAREAVDFISEEIDPSLFSSQEVSMRPSKSTGFFLISGFILLALLIPQFSLQYFSPTPSIQGPFISRTASEGAVEALQYIETLDPSVFGSGSSFSSYRKEYFLTNSTLDFFLEKITTGTSLESGFHPYSYKFNWSVAVQSSSFPEVNHSILSYFWNGDIPLLIWWDNGTRFEERGAHIDDLYSTGFQNFSRTVTWAFYGEMSYDEVFGELGGHFIDVKQLIFLNEELELVCSVFSQYWAVS